MTLQSDRTTIKRVSERAAYDRETVYSILDDSYLCHVGVVVDDLPIVLPTLYARLDDHLLLHGSPASRLLRTAKKQEICVTVTLVDGFVLARSALHHSMNYRSVTIIGQAEVVPAEEKANALNVLVEHLTPDRIPYLRPMLDSEVKMTSVLRLPIEEASAKVRTGPPGDEEEDYDLPIWAGVVPVTPHYGEPETDPAMRMEVDIPDHVKAFRAGR
ncbi:MAG: pyridoxamine 5'-phosphate oxidase family protein [Actinomycetia bacterium]|nr:pyridoxamine 5'-phosphate oxidase family protein [Actinomycetes bacterium]MCP4228237.1 pyridoxamine 5'-phosphate oxidase family protein [Actinomycetes bacterium]MCP5031019.1 pyridoxamine 5'-phosphate oxidase family protein [Actinomycetes bacterium]